MILHTLRLRSFRAHAESEFDLAPSINLLYGANGAGKTNVLEAVHYLCLTKSFTASRDRYAVRKDAPYFEIEGRIGQVREEPMTVRLAYVPGEGKSIFVNGAELDRLADIVGTLPVVVFSPEDYDLTAGGPSERRRFVNNILSQARSVYMETLMKYRRARRQRNEVLRSYKKRSAPPPDELLAPWTEKLVGLGSRIVHRRQQFLQAFADDLEEAYRRIDAVAERPTIEYDTIADLAPDATPDAIEDAFRAALARKQEQERDRGTTLVGPQRDELVFRLDDLEVRRYGSQGQHRTFAMALKLAQYFYLQQRNDTEPLLLLDDAFGKLDAERTGVFLDLLRSDAVGQSLVTATRRGPFEPALNAEPASHRALQVRPSGGTAAVTPDPEYARGEATAANGAASAPTGADAASTSRD
ncbi:DNA replication and repair protein RecF [Salinibacter ruber]|uniref:DNA replication/repair protein RecF n=1 Tax=Salinibacter ruber TaxID=146919 RepID=UPI00216A85DB|nr:DNA replication/repair protein RecF [Salinibacter ruber]MCS3700330.1 DNA replication and repair protein RecF [Salinibacter ruber]